MFLVFPESAAIDNFAEGKITTIGSDSSLEPPFQSLELFTTRHRWRVAPSFLAIVSTTAEAVAEVEGTTEGSEG
jgi:hypothetical protein